MSLNLNETPRLVERGEDGDCLKWPLATTAAALPPLAERFGEKAVSSLKVAPLFFSAARALPLNDNFVKFAELPPPFFSPTRMCVGWLSAC